jgi:hypothetical protein
VIVAVFVRRLRDGVTFDDFIEAWGADRGFGVPSRVFNAVSLEDPREILSIGSVDVEASAFASGVAGVAEQEAVRHSRLEAVVESTVLLTARNRSTSTGLAGGNPSLSAGRPASTKKPSPPPGVMRLTGAAR